MLRTLRRPQAILNFHRRHFARSTLSNAKILRQDAEKERLQEELEHRKQFVEQREEILREITQENLEVSKLFDVKFND